MNDSGKLILYRSKDGAVQLDAQLDKETIWLSQKQMAQLFWKDTDTIGLHIRNVYKESELEESATTEESSVVRTEGKRKVTRTIRFYNEVTPEVKNMLKALEGEMSRVEIQEILMLKDEKHFREHYQQKALELGLLEMTIPDKPRSRSQKYRITEKGNKLIEGKNE